MSIKIYKMYTPYSYMHNWYTRPHITDWNVKRKIHSYLSSYIFSFITGPYFCRCKIRSLKWNILGRYSLNHKLSFTFHFKLYVYFYLVLCLNNTVFINLQTTSRAVEERKTQWFLQESYSLSSIFSVKTTKQT